MEIVFLGHQSWLISEGKTNILLDPVLSGGFGNKDDNDIEIYPPRKIDFSTMPKIDAVILSHEHSDHFHIPTLNKFKDVPIVVGPLFVNCAQKIIQDHQLAINIIPFQVSHRIGSLEIILYPAGFDTVFWESRVAQVFIRSVDNPNNSFFIAVDALVSVEFKEDIINEQIDLPRVIAVSNNSQITPPGVLGSLDNFKVPNSTGNTPFIGLSILKEVLHDYLEEIEEIENIVICGGGFTKQYDTFFGAFPFSDQSKLAAIANSLSINRKIFGPVPGQKIKIDEEHVEYCPSQATWVQLDEQRLHQIAEAGEKYRKTLQVVEIKPVSQIKIPVDFSMLKNELNKMAKVFMLSHQGNLAIDYLASKSEYYTPYGLVINFRENETSDKKLRYGLNFNSSEFELINDYCEESTIPFGVELFLNDFLCIINGIIQIWDIGGIGLKSWYIGSKLNSPTAFLYSYYGEQIHPILNYECYKKRWPIEKVG